MAGGSIPLSDVVSRWRRLRFIGPVRFTELFEAELPVISPDMLAARLVMVVAESSRQRWPSNVG